MTDTLSSHLEAPQAEMRARMDKYAAAWMALDLETVLSFFVDEGLDYSDYGLMAMHMDKKALTDFVHQVGANFADMKIETTDVNSAGNFFVWESTHEFNLLQDIPGCPFNKGERAKLFNARRYIRITRGKYRS
ncbi:hypothetical protein GGR56DRAFT_637117 [Xylariaceae sp. FL0804]|nr:hypothetical protein GGR56DRAFT_637117 [Xylariaceae sp. FL0804]